MSNRRSTVLSDALPHSSGERPRLGSNPFTFFYERPQGPHTVLLRGKSAAVGVAIRARVATVLAQAQYQAEFEQVGPEVLRLAITSEQIQTDTPDNTATALAAIETKIREGNAGIVIDYQKRVRVS